MMFEEYIDELFEDSTKKNIDALTKRMQEIDNTLLNERDKSILLVKDFKYKTIWTPQTGRFKFKRRRYYNTKTKKYCFLLDEKLKITRRKIFSEKQRELALKYFMNCKSYQDIADLVFGGMISKSTIHNFIKNSKVKYKSKKLKCDKNGILCINGDGLWLKLNGTTESVETKNFVIYSGCSRDRKSQKNKLKNKTIIGFINKSTDHIAKELNKIISNYAGVREIRFVGDGANWTKNLCKKINAKYYIDKFHYRKSLHDLACKDKSTYHEMMALVEQNMPPKELRAKLYIAAANNRTGEITKQQQQLIGYLVNNRRHYLNNLIDNPIGIIECLQSHYVARYFKHQRKGWCIRVLNNLMPFIFTRINFGYRQKIRSKKSHNDSLLKYNRALGDLSAI